MKINFMLIDDMEIDLFITQKIIEKLSIDCKFKTFTRAKLAIEYLSALDTQPGLEPIFFPDIILVDINMPEMNGFQFLNKFNELKNEKFNTVKTYLLSSSTNLKDIIDAEQNEACDGFISKPLTTHRVESLVNELRERCV